MVYVCRIGCKQLVDKVQASHHILGQDGETTTSSNHDTKLVYAALHTKNKTKNWGDWGAKEPK
jgi:hypothetical protein